MTAYAELEQHICQWALTRDDLRAVVLIGSRARDQHPADPFSDLDLMLFTTDPHRYQSDRRWLDSFGTVLFATSETVEDGSVEWIALYNNMLKADFTFMPAADVPSLADQIPLLHFQNVLARGMRVLVDKYPRSNPISVALRPAHMPTAPEFEQAVANFWMTATRVAKFIQRGDLWRAVTMLYCKMRAQLMHMLEWHAHAVHGLDHDTWYDGRFLDDWLDADIRASLPDIFAHYDAAELRSALHHMVLLFRRVAQVVAHKLGYDYPQAADDQVTAWLQTI